MNIIDSSPFWSSFFAQLFASFIVIIIGSVIVPPILQWFQRAKLTFFKTNSRNIHEFHFTPSEDGQWEASLNLSIKNLGKKTIDRLYWETYIEKDLQPEFVLAPPYPNNHQYSRQNGEKYVRRFGYIQMPIFSLDDIDFPFEIKFKVKEPKQISIFYYFRTDYGNSPFWSWIAVGLRKFSWLKSLKIT